MYPYTEIPAYRTNLVQFTPQDITHLLKTTSIPRHQQQYKPTFTSKDTYYDDLIEHVGVFVSRRASNKQEWDAELKKVVQYLNLYVENLNDQSIVEHRKRLQTEASEAQEWKQESITEFLQHDLVPDVSYQDQSRSSTGTQDILNEFQSKAKSLNEEIRDLIESQKVIANKNFQNHYEQM